MKLNRLDKEWDSHTQDWRDGYKAEMHGDVVEMSRDDYFAKSEEWRKGASFAYDFLLRSGTVVYYGSSAIR